MSLPYAFANVTELDTPQLDANFNAVGALTVIPCVASGTNAITLTPAANTPTISGYSNNAPEFSFEAAATSSGALTLQVLGLGLKNVYKNNGATAAGANDFLSGSTYKVTYNAALNGAAGGWVILNQGASSASAGSVQGTFKALKVQVTSNTAIAVTASQIAVSDGSTNFTTIFAPSLTINTGSTGTNGIDTGSIGSSTWYYVYAIYNVNTLTAAGLISLSSTAPTLPSGYAQFARVGAVVTDGSANLMRTLQYGRKAQYVITAATNTAASQVFANDSSGAVGTYSVTSPTLATASIVGFIPTTAAAVTITASTTWKTSSLGGLMVAPSTAYGGTNNGPQGSNGMVYPIWLNSLNGGGAFNATATILLESNALAWATQLGHNALAINGWEDNL